MAAWMSAIKLPLWATVMKMQSSTKLKRYGSKLHILASESQGSNAVEGRAVELG